MAFKILEHNTNIFKFPAFHENVWKFLNLTVRHLSKRIYRCWPFPVPHPLILFDRVHTPTFPVNGGSGRIFLSGDTPPEVSRGRIFRSLLWISNRSDIPKVSIAQGTSADAAPHPPCQSWLVATAAWRQHPCVCWAVHGVADLNTSQALPQFRDFGSFHRSGSFCFVINLRNRCWCWHLGLIYLYIVLLHWQWIRSSPYRSLHE